MSRNTEIAELFDAAEVASKIRVYTDSGRAKLARLRRARVPAQIQIDHDQLLLWGLLNGMKLDRWDGRRGELVWDGMRYACAIDRWGFPVVPSNLWERLVTARSIA